MGAKFKCSSSCCRPPSTLTPKKCYREGELISSQQTNKQISIPRLKSVQQSSLSSDSTIATFCFSVLCLFPPALLWLLWPDHLHRKLTKIVPLQARWAVHISVRDPHNLSMPSSLPSHLLQLVPISVPISIRSISPG